MDKKCRGKQVMKHYCQDGHCDAPRSIADKHSHRADCFDTAGLAMTGRALKTFISDNLTALHRMSWRHYLKFLVLIFSFSFAISTVSFAAETKAAGPVSLVKLLSQEKKTAAAQITQEKAPESAKRKDEKTVEKTVKGTVSFIRKNKMAVEYAATEQGGEEIFLTIDKEVKVKNTKKFSDISQGDTVQVKYTETYREPKEKGGERFVLSMVVNEILFVGKAKTGLSS